MNQSNSHSGGAQTFPIKVAKTNKGFEASSPAVKTVAPVTAPTRSSAILNFQVAVDAAIKKGDLKTG